MKNFRLIQTELIVQPLVKAIEERSSLWDQITGRQDYEGSAHRYTRSIFLRWCEKQDLVSAFTDIEAIDYPALKELLPFCEQPILNALKTIDCQELGRILITELTPGGKIYPHIDEGAVADYYDRFHICLKSEPGNDFHCGDETAWMKPGDLWWFNNKETHWLENKSDKPRWHLIIDAVSRRYKRDLNAIKV